MTQSAQRFSKQDKFWINVRKIVDDVSVGYDKSWIKRSRGINSKFLINFIFQIVTEGKKGYSIIASKMWSDYMIRGLDLPQERKFSQSSICAARQKLSAEIFKDLNNYLILTFEDDRDISNNLLEGHRIFAVDGSKVNLPKELEDDGYKVNNEGSYYPQDLLSCIYNLETYTSFDFELSNKFDERALALNHLKKLQKEDIVIFDRGYFSYFMLHYCFSANIYPVFRLQLGLRNKEVMNFINSDEDDKIINYIPSITTKYDLKKRGIELDMKPIKIRLIKYKIGDNIYYLATTLLDQEKYPTKLFQDLYHRRWDIEELYKIIKQDSDLEIFHSKTERGVKQEIYAIFTLINISRFLEFQSKNKHNINNKTHKLNFRYSLEKIKDHIIDLLFAKITNFLQQISYIIDDIANSKYKLRPNRRYPRISHRPRNRWNNFGRNNGVTT